METLRWLDEMETVVDISGCAEKDIVKYVSQSFKGNALIWWKALMHSSGKVHLYNLGWSKFVDLVKDTYCPPHEVEKIELDFLGLTMKDWDCRKYVTEFDSYSRLVSYLITPELKCIARFINGLAPEIRGMVKAVQPATYKSAVELSLALTQDYVRRMSVTPETNRKRKGEGEISHRFHKKG